MAEENGAEQLVAPASNLLAQKNLNPQLVADSGFYLNQMLLDRGVAVRMVV